MNGEKHKAQAYITFDNVRSSFTKRQDMFPVILALCFVLKYSSFPDFL